MRKRVRLGLAEPAVANRFLLWGIASLSTGSIFLVTSTVVYTEPKQVPLFLISLGRYTLWCVASLHILYIIIPGRILCGLGTN